MGYISRLSFGIDRSITQTREQKVQPIFEKWRYLI